MPIAIVRAPGSDLEPVLAALAAADLPARLFADVADFQRASRRDTFDLVLLDAGLAAHRLGALIVELRGGPLSKASILLLVGADQTEAAAEGLYAGADDFLPLSSPPELLVAKLVAVGRRGVAPDRAAWRAGPYVIDWQARTVMRRGRRVGLTRKEFALLETLLAGSGRPLSRSYLLDTVWGPQRDHDTRTLDAHVYRLRNKLALRAETALRLTPVYGYGYQLDILDSF